MPPLTIQGAKRRITFAADNLIKEDFIGLARRVIKRTPSITGRTRANWVIGLGRKSRAKPKLKRRDPSGQATLSAIATKMRNAKKVRKKTFLTNSVPWIRKLEFHVPHAMIRLTAAEHRPIAEAAARRVRAMAQRVR